MDVVSATTKFSSKIDISHEKHLFDFMFDIGLETSTYWRPSFKYWGFDRP